MNKHYFLQRLLFIPITLFGIMILNFFFTQLAPGGPIEVILGKINSGNTSSINARLSGNTQEVSSSKTNSYSNIVTLEDDLKKELSKQFGFDKPLFSRFLIMMKNYLFFDFGTSFYQDKKVTSLIFEKMPVSISLGVFSTLFVYLISIPLGIKKALYNDSSFDKITTLFLTIFYAIPSFLLSVFFIILFCGGHYLNIFPLKGLISDNFDKLTWFHQILDYLWHLILPVLSLSLAGLASLTFLTKNAFVEEIHKNYYFTAKAKGLTENKILYKHVFRNAMLIVIAGFPSVLMSMFFTGSVLIEIIFSLDGLGLLGYESVQNRDFPVIFGTLYLFTFLGLILNLISDFIYTLIDPRINFNKRVS